MFMGKCVPVDAASLGNSHSSGKTKTSTSFRKIKSFEKWQFHKQKQQLDNGMFVK